MRILGIDFTSAPSAAKPLVVADCELARGRLRLRRFVRFDAWPGYERFLRLGESWIGGFDFPFGLPRRFVETEGLPRDWPGLVDACAAMGKTRFARLAMRAFRTARTPRERHRATDLAAGSHSPLKTLANPPVGKMFYEGAWRLLAAGLCVPRLAETACGRVALEAFPGHLARALGLARYKNDQPSGARRLLVARHALLCALCAGAHLGVRLEAKAAAQSEAVADPSGDALDALVCAVQAAWAAGQPGYGLPPSVDRVEGWIVSVPAA